MNVLAPAFQEMIQELLPAAEVPAFLEALQGPSPISVRYNPGKIAATTELPKQQVPWANHAYYLEQRPAFVADPLFHAGQYYVQEASSMLIEQALRQTVELQQPLQVLDLCAAPGGKSTLLASLLSEDSLLLSNEVIRSRAQILTENIQKWGDHKVMVSQNDPAEIAKALPGFFDVVLVDAPCSGEGMFRKAPHSIDEWSPKAVQHCSLRQQRILHEAWKCLKSGGILIYSTCTYNRSENEENIAQFQKEHAFSSLALELDKAWGITATTNSNLHAYRCYPHKVKGEGFFMTVLQKEGTSKSKLPKLKKQVSSKAKKEAQPLRGWLQTPDLFAIREWQNRFYAVQNQQVKNWDRILASLRVVYAGMELAESTKKEFKPLPAAALWTGLQRDAFPTANLDWEAAIDFLQLQGLAVDLVQPLRGWQLVSYQNQPMGWIKVLANRCNNYYPKNWKIRLSKEKLR